MEFKKLNIPYNSPSFPNPSVSGFRFPTFYINKFISMYRYKRLTNCPSLGNEGQELLYF